MPDNSFPTISNLPWFLATSAAIGSNGANVVIIDDTIVDGMAVAIVKGNNGDRGDYVAHYFFDNFGNALRFDERGLWLVTATGGFAIANPNGEVGDGTGAGVFASLQVSGANFIDLNGVCTPVELILPATAAPATSGAAGTAGEVRYDATYLYVCVATNTWKRMALSTW